jgi:urease accessory protein
MNRSKFLAFIAIIPFLLILASTHPVSAHVSTGDPIGLSSGFLHPLGGLDHIIAMLAVGLLAVQKGGKFQWLLPSTFVGAMLAGSVLGNLQAPFPGVEMGIIGSDLLLGGLILANLPIPTAAVTIAIAGFGLFHGYAHGAEMPTNALGFAYGSGFIVATILLHATGMAVGYAIDRFASLRRQQWFQFGGTAILIVATYAAVKL